jgi:hypothetical protein
VRRKQRNQWVRRDDRYPQIIKACIVIERRGQRPTVASIAKYMGLSVSSHLRGIINELTVGEYPVLHKLEEVHWNGKKTYVYLVDHASLYANCYQWYNIIVAEIGVQTTLFTGEIFPELEGWK